MNVWIIDVNDNVLMFSSMIYNVLVKEDELVGFVILILKVIDFDSGKNLEIRY